MNMLSHILNIIFPAVCKQCGCFITTATTTTACFCNKCWEGIKWFNLPCCPRCGIPYHSLETSAEPFPVSSSGHTCGECIKNPPYFDRAISAGPYTEVLAEAIKLFKYKKKIHIGLALAGHDVMVAGLTNLIQSCPEAPFLIPVPLHQSRLREREYNQSAISASVISSKFSIPLMTDVLLRQRYTKPQVELGFRERKENVTGAFSIQNNEVIKGKNIILVDDVYTTGSTVNECAKALKKNGAGKVYVVTIARMIP